MTANAAAGLRGVRGRFYVWMAGIAVAIAFGLFAPTYWLQVPAGTFTGAPLLHLHGLLFSAWVIFFLSQTLLAANGRLESHRTWGMLGIALATAMLFSGFATGIKSMTNGIAGGHADAARAFAIVPLSAIVIFAGLVCAAIMNVKRPETHKRLMLVATLSILQAPLDRIFFALHAGIAPGLRPGSGPPPPVQATMPSGLIAIALILAVVVYDWRTRGKPHNATLISGAIVAAAVFLRAPLGSSAAWQSAANFLAHFAG